MTKKTSKNYYNILGVTPDSESAEVKTAYRKLARELHPDVNKDPDCVQKFKDVIEAYETLSNDTKRKEYDMINGFYKTPKSSKVNPETFDNIRQTPKHDTFEKEQKSTAPNSERKTASAEKEKFCEDVRKNNFKSSINSILEEITRKHFSSEKVPQLKDGDDIRSEIEIDLKEALTGCERILNILHREVCPHCRGHRFINGSKCKSCNGSGEFELKKKITVKIPPNVKNNAILRIKGEGNPGFFGGKNGNLYITIKIKESTNIKIEGNTIFCKLVLTPCDAVLGGDFEIRDFSEKIKLTIPPMTNSGQKFRLSKQGMKTNGKIGDMIVTVEIRLPEKISKEEVALYAKLKKISNTLSKD